MKSMRNCLSTRVAGTQRTREEMVHSIFREVRLLNPIRLTFGIRQRQTYVPIHALPLFMYFEQET